MENLGSRDSGPLESVLLGVLYPAALLLVVALGVVSSCRAGLVALDRAE